MFAAFGNIAKIPELRKKVGITLGLLVLARIGVFIPIPGVDLAAIQQLLETSSGDIMGRITGLLDMFSGGGLSKASIFALGVMPYISSSIIFQLLTAIVPALQKVAKDGESGRRKIHQWTRWVTIALCLVQGIFICSMLQKEQIGGRPMVKDPGLFFVLQTAILITAGTAFLMWLGEQIDEFGIGSGISLLIQIGILSRLPMALNDIRQRFTPQLDSTDPSQIGPGQLILLLGLFVFMVVAVVFVTEAVRRIPMQTHKRSAIGFRQQHFLPLKLNASGVIAIIFAQALMILPPTLSYIPQSFLQSDPNSPFWKFFADLIAFFGPGRFMYETMLLFLIIFFSYFYTAILFDPKEHAENFKQNGVFIPGIRPGFDTRTYLEQVMNRITFTGAIFIAIVAVAPQLIQHIMNVDFQVADFFGGTGLLIVVGVALDVVNRLESHMIRERYEGFLRGGGRIRGRRG